MPDPRQVRFNPSQEAHGARWRERERQEQHRGTVRRGKERPEHRTPPRPAYPSVRHAACWTTGARIPRTDERTPHHSRDRCARPVHDRRGQHAPPHVQTHAQRGIPARQAGPRRGCNPPAAASWSVWNGNSSCASLEPFSHHILIESSVNPVAAPRHPHAPFRSPSTASRSPCGTGLLARGPFRGHLTPSRAESPCHAGRSCTH